MNNVAATKKKPAAKPAGLKKLLFDEFFVPYKGAGLREGFRRLALLLGGGAFVWTYSNAQEVADYTLQISGVLGVGMTIAVALMCVISFFVVAAVTKTIGWVLEGFLGQ